MGEQGGIKLGEEKKSPENSVKTKRVNNIEQSGICPVLALWATHKIFFNNYCYIYFISLR